MVSHFQRPQHRMNHLGSSLRATREALARGVTPLENGQPFPTGVPSGQQLSGSLNPSISNSRSTSTQTTYATFMSNCLMFKFCKITEKDQEFLYQLYANTREAEMKMTGWDLKKQDEFLRMQFNAQHQHYQKHYADADFQLIQLNGTNIGRLYVEELNDEFRLIDIALVADQRNKGYGGKLMQQLLSKAQESLKPVRLHVEQFNPAWHFYARLGFETIENRGVYLFMEWQTHTKPTKASPLD